MKLANIESKFIKTAGEFAGVCFGYSFCDEHDDGYSGIMESLGVGMDVSAKGLNKLRVAVAPENIYLVSGEHKAAIVMSPGIGYEAAAKLARELSLEINLGDEELASFWDIDSFVLLAAGTGAGYIRELHKDIVDGNVIFALPEGSVFSQQMYPALARGQFARSEWASRLSAA